MSDMLHLDFTGVKVGFDPVPDGFYPVVIQEVESKQSKSGNPMLVVRFAIQDPEEFFGRLLFANYSLLPRALWKLKQLLTALDPEGDYDGPLELEPADLINLECTAVVISEEYDGKVRNRIKTVTEAGGAFVAAESSSAKDDDEYDFAV